MPDSHPLRSPCGRGLDSPLSPGPVLALALAGYNITDHLQSLAGASDPKLAAKTDPGSWRARFGVDRANNAISTCRHLKGAANAMQFFFAAGGGDAAPRCVLRAPLTETLLLSRAAAAELAPLLPALQRAGFALHAAARLASPQEFQAAAAAADSPGVLRKAHELGFGEEGAMLLLVLSREGQSLAYAQRLIDEAGMAATSSACECPPPLAQLLTCGDPKISKCIGAASLRAEVDMFAYVLFSIKAGLI